MIEINGKIYRNLQEQVLKNKEDIEALAAGGGGGGGGTSEDGTYEVIRGTLSFEQAMGCYPGVPSTIYEDFDWMDTVQNVNYVQVGNDFYIYFQPSSLVSSSFAGIKIPELVGQKWMITEISVPTNNTSGITLAPLHESNTGIFVVKPDASTISVNTSSYDPCFIKFQRVR